MKAKDIAKIIVDEYLNLCKKIENHQLVPECKTGKLNQIIANGFNLFVKDFESTMTLKGILPNVSKQSTIASFIDEFDKKWLSVVLKVNQSDTDLVILRHEMFQEYLRLNKESLYLNYKQSQFFGQKI